MPNTRHRITAVGAEVITKTVDIANGASLSGVVDLATGRLARIDMPAAWTAADLSFQVSNDNVTFRNLYNAAGTEYSVKADASRAVIISLVDFLGAQYIKIRSGLAGAAVAQGAARSLTLQVVL